MMLRRRIDFKKIPGTPVNAFSPWFVGKTIGANGSVTSNDDVQFCNEFLDTSLYAINDKIVFYDNTYNNGFFVALAFYNDTTFVSRIGYNSGTRNINFNIPSTANKFKIILVYKIGDVAIEPATGDVPLNELYLQSEN